MAGLPYVGSGVFSSAASMDKEFTKKLLAAAGLPQGDHVVLRDAAGAVCPDPAVLDEAARERLGLPVFVKPARAGSSIGITKVTDWAQFPEAVATAAAVDRRSSSRPPSRAGRSSAPSWRRGGAGCRRRACRRRSGCARASTGTTSRRSTSTPTTPSTSTSRPT